MKNQVIMGTLIVAVALSACNGNKSEKVSTEPAEPKVESTESVGSIEKAKESAVEAVTKAKNEVVEKAKEVTTAVKEKTAATVSTTVNAGQAVKKKVEDVANSVEKDTASNHAENAVKKSAEKKPDGGEEPECE